MTVARTAELDGHISDSGTMQRWFGVVMDLGGNFDVEKFVPALADERTA